MNHENMETRDLLMAADHERIDKKEGATLILRMALLIICLYALFFAGSTMRWPIIGAALFVYIILRIV